jgi:hypothetical protein
MKRVLVFAAAVAALGIAGSAASAQECVNGYRTLESDIVVPCGDGMAGAAIAPPVVGTDAGMTSATPPTYEPLTTGSIAVPPPAGAGSGQIDAATNPSECVPGGYWWIESHDAATPMKC